MKFVIGLAAMGLLMSGSPVFAKSKCGLSEGDDFVARGKYLMMDVCKLHGNIEAVNTNCTKAKIRVSKVTAAFGLKVKGTCRITGAEGSAGDVIWVPLTK